MKRSVVAGGLIMLLVASAPQAAAAPDDADACPSVILNPWNDLDDVRPECADAWRAELEATGVNWAAFVEHAVFMPDEKCDELPRGAGWYQSVPSAECAARWAATVEGLALVLGTTFVDEAASGADHVVTNSADSDGDGLPQLLEHQVCGRAGVEALVTGALELGACNGIEDYVAPL